MVFKQHKPYQLAQKEFDREARCLQIKWKREEVLKLEKLKFEDAEEFWCTIKSMGRNSKGLIPGAGYNDDVNITTNIDDFMRKWDTEFGSLLNPAINDSPEYELYGDHITKLNKMHEELSVNRPSNEFDRDFTMSEVRKVVMNNKNSKSPGYNGIVNEVMKYKVGI